MAGAFKRERTLSIAQRRSVMSTALITLTPAVTIGSVKTREKAAVTCVFTASTNVHDGVVALALHAPPQPPEDHSSIGRCRQGQRRSDDVAEGADGATGDPARSAGQGAGSRS